MSFPLFEAFIFSFLTMEATIVGFWKIRRSARESITIVCLPGFTSLNTQSGNFRGIPEFQPRKSFRSTTLEKLSLGRIFLVPVDIKTDSVEETFKNCLRMEADDDDGGDTRRIQLLSSPPDISLSSMAM